MSLEIGIAQPVLTITLGNGVRNFQDLPDRLRRSLPSLSLLHLGLLCGAAVGPPGFAPGQLLGIPSLERDRPDRAGLKCAQSGSVAHLFWPFADLPLIFLQRATTRSGH